MKVYVASSWRNSVYPSVVDELRVNGHDVYDFRNPPSKTGFAWSQVKPEGAPEGVVAKGADWERVEDFQAMLAHPVAEAGFRSDLNALLDADVVVMVLPCGKSAHLELGIAMGMGNYLSGKTSMRTAILLEDPVEPELMYLGADFLASSLKELVDWLSGPIPLCEPKA